jgi:hypothetical protein
VTVTRTIRNALAVGLASTVVLGVSLLGELSASAAGSALSTTTLSASPTGPVVTGQSVTFTATVAPQTPGGSPTPTGSVLFGFSAGRVVCAGGTNTIVLVSGVASCTVGLPGGSSPVTVDAKYFGDTSYAISNGQLSEVVGLAETTTALVASIDHATGSGKPVNFVATVAPVAPATGDPTGSVTFTLTGSDGSQAFCANGIAIALNHRAGSAKCQVPGGVLVASAAPWTVAATYSGDVNDAGSSNTYSQDVHSTVTTTHISSSPSPPALSEALQITASVTVPKFAVLPTGTLTFSFTTSTGTPLPIGCEGGTNALSLTSNFATCTLPAGVEPHGTKYGVKATYSGDANNGTSASGVRPLLVH